MKTVFHFLVLIVMYNFSLIAGDLETARDTLKVACKWLYPYPELVDHLKAEEQSSILIFSYGSLMDIKSAQETLSPETMETRRPAIAYGVKRTFDRDVPIKPLSKWKVPADPTARGMLNVIPSDAPEEFVNGVIIDVKVEDIPRILTREEGYDLIPVLVQEWDTLDETIQPIYFVAYTFHAPQNSSFTSSDVNPRPGYYELTRNAANQFGPIFSMLWFNTTYLSDGVTPVTAWEDKVLKNDPATLIKVK